MSQKKLVEEIKTCILCWTGFFSEHRNVYQIMLKNTVQPDRRQVTIRYGAEKTHFAWSITKPKINAQNYCFLQQQCLCKRLSLPCYTYIEWLVTSNTGKTHITFSQSNVESNGNGFPNCAQQMFQTGQIFLTGFSRFSLVPQYLWPWDITPPPGLLPSTPFILRFIGVNICVCVYIYIYIYIHIYIAYITQFMFAFGPWMYSGYLLFMYQQINTRKFYIQPTQHIYVLFKFTNKQEVLY